MDYSGVMQSDLTNLIVRFGDLGVFLAMFFESSVVPLPSEVIIISAGAIGIPLAAVLIFGGLGSTLGAMVGYALGRYAAMPVLLKFGKFVLIKPHHIYKAEEFARKYGIASVLIGRVLPVVPFKVFSIAAGITRLPFIPFVLCTLVGVLPRILILAIFGSAIIKHTKVIVILVIFAALIFIAFKVTHLFYEKRKVKPKGGSR
ncbi:MAG: VTT domain-containing protein [Candidatus Omnitrophica bacterium]|nr:VTT domain-containing protein [Candidatus Omnitrophota bacterium]